MAHFAKVENGIVTEVIVAEQDVIDSGVVGGGWVQTSYNTIRNVHLGPDGQPDGGVALRGNFAGIGDIYDEVNDIFYPPKPYPSWKLDFNICTWVSPTPLPDNDNAYYWDEPTLSWVLLE